MYKKSALSRIIERWCGMLNKNIFMSWIWICFIVLSIPESYGHSFVVRWLLLLWYHFWLLYFWVVHRFFKRAAVQHYFFSAEAMIRVWYSFYNVGTIGMEIVEKIENGKPFNVWWTGNNESIPACSIWKVVRQYWGKAWILTDTLLLLGAVISRLSCMWHQYSYCWCRLTVCSMLHMLHQRETFGQILCDSVYHQSQPMIHWNCPGG